MSKPKKNAKPKPPKVSAEEKEQARIRRQVGHDFALRTDAFGRSRLAVGTFEAKRKYEMSNGGVVRVRNIDPLVGISSLSSQQRDAGGRYRDVFEICTREGMKTGAFQERVDGGGMASSVPARLLDAGADLAKARLAIGHHEIVGVIDKICGEQLSVSAVAERTGDRRDAVIKLLKIGLDNLAEHYGLLQRRPLAS